MIEKKERARSEGWGREREEAKAMGEKKSLTLGLIGKVRRSLEQLRASKKKSPASHTVHLRQRELKAAKPAPAPCFFSLFSSLLKRER